MRATRFTTERSVETHYVVGPQAWDHPWVHEALRDRPAAVVVDSAVLGHHRSRLDALLGELDLRAVIELPGGEGSKTTHHLVSLLDAFEQCGLPKAGVVVAIGGGAVSDVAGLASTVMRRGIDLVVLPTTLLAQVDAAVGGKNGINSATAKNIVGSFHHPLVVASDPALLRTLDERQLAGGAAECVKVFAVSDGEGLARHRPTLLDPGEADDAALARLIADAQDRKLELLGDDPFERSSRRLLNYGHAFAHLLEERSGFTLLHGEAVLLGMLLENELSRLLGIAEDGLDPLQALTLGMVGSSGREHWLPFEQVAGDLDKVRGTRRATMSLVCVRRPGAAVVVDDVAPDDLATCWQRVDGLLAGTSGLRDVPA